MNAIERIRLSQDLRRVIETLSTAIDDAPASTNAQVIEAMELDHETLSIALFALEDVRTDDERIALRQITSLFERYPAAANLSQLAGLMIADLKRVPDVEINPNARCLGCGQFMSLDPETMRAVRIGSVTHAGGNREKTAQLCGGQVAPLSLLEGATS